MKVFVLMCLTAVMVCLAPFSGFAATWYVRTDGGTITQCTGLTDAAYPGTGTNQACAVNHLFWLLSAKDQTMVIAGGDTVIIGPGSYMMGINQTGDQAPNTGTGRCSSGNATYTCMMPPLPSGPDTNHPTTIIGKNWDTKNTAPPELWGAGRIAHIFDLTNSNNVVLQYLNITDHAQCGYNMVGSPMMCNRTTAPYGYQADNGIYAKDSSNVLLKDVSIHGMSMGGIQAGRVTDWTLDTVTLIANAFDGWNGDLGTHGAFGSGTDTSQYGTMTIKNSKINYSGCVENYPLTGVYPDVATGGCYGQTLQGYGDGVGMYYNDANWVIQDTEFMHNTQDGLDLLYHTGQTGTIQISRVRAEGNAGQQLKVGASTHIDNSVIIGDCSFYYNNPFAEAPFTADNCRAGSAAISLQGWRPGHYFTITNSTVVAPDYIMMEVGNSTQFSARTGGVAGTIANVTAMNQYAVNQSLDTMWVWWPGGYNPNQGEIIPEWGGYTSRVTLTGTWIPDGNGIYHMTGIGAQTGGNYNFDLVFRTYVCDGTEKMVSRNNIYIGMGPFSPSTNAIVPGKTTVLVYLDGVTGNSDGPCAAINPVIMDNRDSIVDNLKAGTNQPSTNASCPNSNDIICLPTDTSSTYLPILNGISLNAYPDLYTLGERWNVVPTDGSPAIDKSSSVVGTVVLGNTVIPSLDMLGGTRLSASSIDWGAYAYRPDYTPPVISINQVVSPMNSLSQNLSGTVSAKNGVSSVTVQLNSQNPQPALFSAGTWNYTASGLIVGNNVITVSSQDSYGNNTSIEAFIQVINNVPPTVTAFTIPGIFNNLTVPITTFTATDNVGVTGYLISESAVTPSATYTGWSGTNPTTYTFVPGTVEGSKTLYAWAKDAAGNVSASKSATLIIDLTPPVITNFTVPIASNSLTVSGITLTATDNNSGVAGYLITESAAAPSVTDSRWSGTAPTTYTFAVSTTAGSKTLYAWAKDTAGNISPSKSATLKIDPASPVITTFTGPIASNSLTVSGITLIATDNNSVVAGYLISESAAAPSVTDSRWSATAPATYTFAVSTTAGSKTLYAWAKDAVGNISSSKSLSVTPLTLPTISDVLKVLQAVEGIAPLSALDRIRYDVAPLGSNGKPLGNGIIDIADVMLLLQRSNGIGNW